jgi:hypothetical protein
MRQHRFTVAVTQTQLATLAELQRRWALPSRAAVVREVIARAALDQLVRDRAEGRDAVTRTLRHRTALPATNARTRPRHAAAPLRHLVATQGGERFRWTRGVVWGPPLSLWEEDGDHTT